MGWESMERAEIESCSAQDRQANAKGGGCLPRRGSQVVRAPAQRLRRVMMDGEADDQPGRKYDPRVRMARLQPPDVPSDEHRESKSFGEREKSDCCPVRHTRFKPT